MICLVLCDYRKMVDEQPSYRHFQMSQHASMRGERDKFSRDVGESSRSIEGPSSHGHVSPTHDKESIAPDHAPDDVVHVHDPHLTVKPDAFVPNSFLRVPRNISLHPLYVHHTVSTCGKER